MSSNSPLLHYLSHPEVTVDPAMPVPEWSLSKSGRMRAKNFARTAALKSAGRIICSTEVKAAQTALIIAKALGLEFEQYPELHENDRSSTGYLAPDEFETAADAFFAEPDKSFRGWETAIDAQSRVVDAVENLMQTPQGGDILMVGHGAVGTLLYCHFASVPIDRKFDQQGGGGNFFSINLETKYPLGHWQPMENFMDQRE